MSGKRDILGNATQIVIHQIYVFFILYLLLMKKYLFLISLFGLLFLFAGCTSSPETCSVNDTSAACSLTTPQDLSGVATQVIIALQNSDFITLANFVGQQWLRFSPYEYINTGTDIILTSGEVYHALAFSRTFTWWTYDGSGEPIDLWIGQYFQKFVYDVDFAQAPEIYVNQKFERGNTINNIFDVYSGKSIIDYHFPQIDPQYEGIDRRSLYLVFDQIDGQWYLIGIVHGAWTI